MSCTVQRIWWGSGVGASSVLAVHYFYEWSYHCCVHSCEIFTECVLRLNALRLMWLSRFSFPLCLSPLPLTHLAHHEKGLYCDIRQLVQFIKESHGNVFRRVALSALLDSAEKLNGAKKPEEKDEAKPTAQKRLVLPHPTHLKWHTHGIHLTI